MDDGRLVRVKFIEKGVATLVRQRFDADPAIPEDE